MATLPDRYLALRRAEINIRQAILELSAVGYNAVRLSDALRDIASLMNDLFKELPPETSAAIVNTEFERTKR